jgi:predicted Rossmann fold flavoprotein
MTMETKVCIIGAGPAGLMAAIFAAKTGARTMAIEANKRPGQKLLLTGGGRCNLTHQATPKELVRAFGDKGNPSSVALRRVKFLSFSLHQFSSQYIQDFFAQLGLRMRIEKDGCVFPASDRAGDVRDTLLIEAKKTGVRFFSTKVQSITKHGENFVISSTSQKNSAEKVIIATGGMSYRETGSTGDGYKFAQHLGHTIIEPRASLVPLVTLEKWPGELAGTSLDNVKITTLISNKKIATTGAMLFTHDGIGGPAVLDLSRLITDFMPSEKNPIKIAIDLVSDINKDELEKMIINQIDKHPKKTVANILSELVPKRIAQILCRQFDFSAELYANQLSKDLRRKLLHLLKAMPLSIVRTRPISEATVTRGGVNVTEIESKTMESKICPGLFFAGEVIDVDGPCGGYNLQMCWSTGALAGISAGRTTPSNAGG